jgi:hypothetical protein
MIYWDGGEVYGGRVLALTVNGHDLVHCSRVYAGNGARLNDAEYQAWIDLIIAAPKLQAALTAAVEVASNEWGSDKGDWPQYLRDADELLSKLPPAVVPREQAPDWEPREDRVNPNLNPLGEPWEQGEREAYLAWSRKCGQGNP